MKWLILGLAALVAACGSGVGACDGYSTVLERRYCQDNFDEAECAEWDEMEVNGASWNFHEGQTCEDRGCGGGSC
jgi:hypothetical protein